MSPRPTSIRIVPELRAVHVQRHRSGTPAELLFLDTNYDLAGTPLAHGIERVTVLSALARFVRTSATTLEVPEPLWMRFWPKHVVLAAGFKLVGLLRGRRRRVVTYAMENNAFPVLVGGRRRAPAWLVRAVALLIGAATRILVDRIWFASPAAHHVYSQLPFVRAVDQRVGLELPAPTEEPTVPTPASCAFVGVLEARKGIDVLLPAWEIVERARPRAVLTIVGPGPEADRIRRWVKRAPARRVLLGRLPHRDTAAVVARSAVLVAPSVPDGRWREQVGLPVKEALAAGVTVVTTDQTGLAPWLTEHGHHVVTASDPDLAQRLADAIVDAIDGPLDRAAVRGSLPERDGRLVADAWLHA